MALQFDPSIFESYIPNLTNENDGEDEIVFDDEEKNEGTSAPAYTSRAVIFVLEAGASAFKGNLTSCWKETVKGISNFIRQRIISNENDLISILIFRSGISKNILNFEGIYEAVPLDFVSVKTIRYVSRLMSLDFKTFCDEFGTPSSQNESKISELFWLSHQMFATKKKKKKKKKKYSALI
eukprot:Trichotokara_eunicae@DN1583_c0_g1_i8.p1